MAPLLLHRWEEEGGGETHTLLITTIWCAKTCSKRGEYKKELVTVGKLAPSLTRNTWKEKHNSLLSLLLDHSFTFLLLLLSYRINNNNRKDCTWWTNAPTSSRRYFTCLSPPLRAPHRRVSFKLSILSSYINLKVTYSSSRRTTWREFAARNWTQKCFCLYQIIVKWLWWQEVGILFDNRLLFHLRFAAAAARWRRDSWINSFDTQKIQFQHIIIKVNPRFNYFIKVANNVISSL